MKIITSCGWILASICMSTVSLADTPPVRVDNTPEYAMTSCMNTHTHKLLQGVPRNQLEPWTAACKQAAEEYRQCLSVPAVDTAARDNACKARFDADPRSKWSR